MGQFGNRMYFNNQPYSFRDMGRLLDALDAWMAKGKDHSPTIALLKKGLIALPEAKRVLIGGELSEISGHEWLQTIATLGKIFNVYLAGSVSFSKGLNGAFTREILPENVDSLVEQLSQSIRNHDGARISMREWRELFAKVEASQLLPATFTGAAMYDAWEWVVRRPMGGSVEEVPVGFSLDHVASLRGMLSDWIVLLKEPIELANSAPILQQFATLLHDSPALKWDSLGRIVFEPSPSLKWEEPDRRQMVLPFVMLSWIKTGYVGPERQSVTFPEFNVAALEILHLLQNFGWCLDSDDGMGKRRFFEANLFMPSSDGGETLTLSEATRYAAFVASSYLAADHWLKLSDTMCAVPRDADCVRNLALDPSLNIMTPFPLVQKSRHEWGDARFLNYIKFAEKTIIGAPAKGRFATADLLRVWQLMKYVEVFMQRYDLDGSDRVNLKEALKAYVLYGPALKKTGKLPEDDDLLLAFFTFLLKFGENPFVMDYGPVHFELWKKQRDSWELSTERDTLMAILAALSSF